jgi:hypothetical protein
LPYKTYKAAFGTTADEDDAIIVALLPEAAVPVRSMVKGFISGGDWNEEEEIVALEAVDIVKDVVVAVALER